MADLRPTDFLPPHFDGETLNRELATSWFLSFQDYLDAHGLQAPDDDDALANVVRIFKGRLSRQARLWVEDQVFQDLDDLKAAFLARFSPTHSDFANVRLFEAITYTHTDTAHQHLCKVRLAAARINYGDPQIRNKFIQTLPSDCQKAVIMASGPNTPVNDLATLAQRYLDISPHVHFSAADQIHAATSTPATATDVTLDAILKKLDSIHVTQPSSHNPPGQRSTSPARSGSPHPNRGHNSRNTDRQDDHRRRRSQSPSRPRSGDRNRPPCHFCGRRNHFWRYCYKFQQQVALGNLPPDFVPPAARNRPQNGNPYGAYGPQSYSQQPPGNSWQRDNSYRPNYYDQQPPNSRQDL